MRDNKYIGYIIIGLLLTSVILICLVPSAIGIYMAYKYKNVTCWSNTTLSAPDWLFTYGFMSGSWTIIITILVFYVECCTGTGCGDTGSTSPHRKKLIIPFTVSSGFQFLWSIIGITNISNSTCYDDAHPLWAMIIAAIFLEWLTIIVCGICICILAKT